MLKISSAFIGAFKIGDNIAHNLNIIALLYEMQGSGSGEQRELLRKPIIILMGSIAEALLYDLFAKINGFTREGVPSISDAELQEIREKTVDDFSKYIDVAMSKKLLGERDGTIYDDLHMLRKLRNRIHIQNTKNYGHQDEASAFSEDKQNVAEQTLERLLQILSDRHRRTYRDGDPFDYVADFVLPWGQD